jgi:hypothetical protein
MEVPDLYNPRQDPGVFRSRHRGAWCEGEGTKVISTSNGNVVAHFYSGRASMPLTYDPRHTEVFDINKASS